METSLPFVPLDELARRVSDGAMLAVPKDEAGVAMAATRALVRREASGLHLLCVPTSGLQADLLIGAGCVATVECGAVTLDEFGPAPRFRAAIEQGRVRILDSTCPAIYAALQASEKGSPFAPLRGLIGSDVQRYRNDWVTIDNPFADTADPIVLLPAIRPDVALFHARLGDRQGNVWVGNKRELVIMAHASRTSVVTVEDVFDGDLVADERYAAGTLPSLYVEAVAHVPRGAWPLGLVGRYDQDAAHIRAYAAAARSVEGFSGYLATHVYGETVVA
jgi:glutaconate CoA-transferase subunit A